MLKKLAKYGNSTTLVIDKAILELLNMDESSIVKLHTDGKSLIITPTVNAEKEKISAGIEEANRSALTNMHAIAVNEWDKKPKAVLPPEVMTEMQQEFKELFERHKTTMAIFTENLASNLEYTEALTLLEQKYNPKTHPENYKQEYMKLRTQFFPELAEMDKEMKAISEKYCKQ